MGSARDLKTQPWESEGMERLSLPKPDAEAREEDWEKGNGIADERNEV
jgi:hypothetical protein